MLPETLCGRGWMQVAMVSPVSLASTRRTATWATHDHGDLRVVAVGVHLGVHVRGEPAVGRDRVVQFPGLSHDKQNVNRVRTIVVGRNIQWCQHGAVARQNVINAVLR